jgi:hypothetical protein
MRKVRGNVRLQPTEAFVLNAALDSPEFDNLLAVDRNTVQIVAPRVDSKIGREEAVGSADELSIDLIWTGHISPPRTIMINWTCRTARGRLECPHNAPAKAEA